MQKLAKMKESKVYGLASTQAIQDFTKVMGLVEKLSQDKPPADEDLTSRQTVAFTRAVVLAANFCRAYDSDAQKFFCGRDAIAAELKRVREVVAAGEIAKPDDMNKFFTFIWLLRPEEKAEVHAWQEAIVAERHKALGIGSALPDALVEDLPEDAPDAEGQKPGAGTPDAVQVAGQESAAASAGGKPAKQKKGGKPKVILPPPPAVDTPKEKPAKRARKSAPVQEDNSKAKLLNKWFNKDGTFAR